MDQESPTLINVADARHANDVNNGREDGRSGALMKSSLTTHKRAW